MVMCPHRSHQLYRLVYTPLCLLGKWSSFKARGLVLLLQAYYPGFVGHLDWNTDSGVPSKSSAVGRQRIKAKASSWNNEPKPNLNSQVP